MAVEEKGGGKGGGGRDGEGRQKEHRSDVDAEASVEEGYGGSVRARE